MNHRGSSAPPSRRFAAVVRAAAAAAARRGTTRALRPARSGARHRRERLPCGALRWPRSGDRQGGRRRGEGARGRGRLRGVAAYCASCVGSWRPTPISNCRWRLTKRARQPDSGRACAWAARADAAFADTGTGCALARVFVPAPRAIWRSGRATRAELVLVEVRARRTALFGHRWEDVCAARHRRWRRGPLAGKEKYRCSRSPRAAPGHAGWRLPQERAVASIRRCPRRTNPPGYWALARR